MTESLDTVLEAFPPNTKHYRLASGDHIAVNADSIPPSAVQSVVSDVLTYVGADLQKTTMMLLPTVVWACTADGLPTEAGMTPLHTFPPGTSHEDAVTQATGA